MRRCWRYRFELQEKYGIVTSKGAPNEVSFNVELSCGAYPKWIRRALPLDDDCGV
jgi:hypothetical protein